MAGETGAGGARRAGRFGALRRFAVALLLLAGLATLAPGVQAGAGQARIKQSSSRAHPRDDRQQARAVRRYERWRRHRESPAARAHRRGSRTAYKHASDAEALGIAEAKHPDVLHAPVWTDPSIGPGSELTSFLSPFAGVVQDDSDRRAIVESSVPLWTTADGGKPEPVDLSLTPNARGFEPRNTPAPVEFPGQIGDGVRLQHSGLEFIPVVSDRTATPERVEGKLFYANTAPDTDMLITPTAEGFESFTQLRSATSPESLAFNLELPHGVHAYLSAQGKIEIARGSDRVAEIPAPTAQDASGMPVPVSYRLQGDVLVLTVRHRNADVAYPVMVDPSIIEYMSFTSPNAPDRDFGGWVFSRYQSSANAIAYTLSGPEGPGIYSYVNQGWTINSGDFGMWTWTAPVDTNIFQVYTVASMKPFYGYYQMVRGIFNPGVGWAGSPRSDVASFTGGTDTRCAASGCPENAGNNQNQLLFYLQANATNTAGALTYGYLSQAQIYLHDGFVPVVAPVTGAGNDGQWHNAGTSWTYTVNATDRGLGMYRVQVDGGNFHQGLQPQCTGQRTWRCPKAAPSAGWDTTFSYDSNSLPEGITSMTASAFDVAGNIGTTPWTVKVDRTDPQVTLSGSLYDGNDFGDGAEGQLHVDASDGIADGNPANARSGVKSIEIKVDTTVEDTATNTDPCDSCGLVEDWGYSSADYTPGPHTITVTVFDFANRKTVQTWSVVSYPTTGANTSEKIDPLDDGTADDLGDPLDAYCLPDAESLSGDYCGGSDALNLTDILADQEPPLEATAANDDFGASPKPGALPPEYVDSTTGGAPAGPCPARSGYGISNPRWEAFDDTRLSTLCLTKDRVIVPWDVVPRASADQTYTLPNGKTVIAKKSPGKLATIDTYMQKAQDHGYQMLVTFERSVAVGKGGKGEENYLPTVSQYQAATDAFRARYRARGQTVPYFTAWNEPNYPAQPTSGHPFPNLQPPAFGAKRAGQFWRNLKKRCVNECTVIAGDFSDRKELSPSYFAAYKNALGYPPPIWAYHPYYAAYNGTGTKPWVARFDKFLKATSRVSGKNSRIWLTEQAPRYDLPKVNYCENVGDQHLKRLLALAQSHSRVTRFYYYAWFGGARQPPPKKNQFDSGLVDVNVADPNDMNRAKLRKAFFTYKSRTNPADPATYPGTPSC